MNYKPDLSLLDDWADVNHVLYPMVAVFQFEDKKLIYVGTRHNTKDRPAPESFDAMNYCFDNFAIDCVVTECEHSKTLDDWRSSIGKPGMNELIYAPYIGNLKNIPYVFADSDEKDWFTDIVKTDINTIKDMQTFFMIDDAHRYKKYFGEPDTIGHALRNVIGKFWCDNYPAPMTASEFAEYCKQHLNVDITDENISNILSQHNSWNVPNKNGNAFNRALSYIGAYSRNPEMLKNIFNAVNKYQCVLVTFGAGHFDAQRRVLEQAFGVPQMIYDFPHTPRRDQNTGSNVLKN